MQDDNFQDWLTELENQEQPACNIENPEECDSCGA